MKKILKTTFSPDIFKAVLYFISLLGVCPLLVGYIEPYLKLLHIYALVVLAVDLFLERRILKNKGRTVLLAFCCGYVLTLLTNRNLLSFSGLSNFMYLFATLALVYSYGKESGKIDYITSTVLTTLISLANIVGIWMFYTKYYQYIPERGYIGMFPYENRLTGLFGNPNVLGMVCLGALCLCFIQVVRCERRWEKAYFIGLGLINFVTLLLSNSRTQIYSLILLSGVVAFMWVLKFAKDWKHSILALGAFVLCMGITFAGCKLCQQGLSKVDVHYNYYLSAICADPPTTDPTDPTDPTEPADPTEPTEPVSPTEPSTSPEEPTVPEPTVPDPVKPSNPTIVRTESNFLNGRLEIWGVGIEVFKEKPLFGCGMDNFEVTLENMGRPNLAVKGNLHNTYLEILADFGVTGFACIAAFLLIMLMNVIKFFRYGDRKKWMLGSVMMASVLAFMLDGVADSTLLASVSPTAVSFWFIASQFANLMEEENSKSGHFKPEPLGTLSDKITAKFKK